MDSVVETLAWPIRLETVAGSIPIEYIWMHKCDVMHGV